MNRLYIIIYEDFSVGIQKEDPLKTNNYCHSSYMNIQKLTQYITNKNSMKRFVIRYVKDLIKKTNSRIISEYNIFAKLRDPENPNPWITLPKASRKCISIESKYDYLSFSNLGIKR